MADQSTKSNCGSKNLNRTLLTLYLTMMFLKNSPVVLVVATKKARKYKTTHTRQNRKF